LKEPSWTTNASGITYPGRIFKKDPQIENTGKNNAAVFLEVLIPRVTVRTFTADNPGIINPSEDLDLFTFSPNEGWIWVNCLDEYPYVETVTDEGVIYSRYVYGFSSEIAPGETTPPLFDSVEFINMLEGEIPMGTPENIIIRAYAVQHMQADLETDTDKDVLLFQLKTAFGLFEKLGDESAP